MPARLGHATLALAVMLAVAAHGASSPKPPPSSSLAKVVIEKATTTDILQATRKVLEEEFYQVTATGTNYVVAERRGSRMNDFAYGGWFGESVWVQVRIRAQPFRDTYHLLECDAFMIRNKDDSFFRDSSKVRFKKKPYQKLLDQVKDHLKENTAKESPPKE